MQTRGSSSFRTSAKPPALLALTLALLLAPAPAAAQPCPSLVWADEFDGTALDTTKWSIQTGASKRASS